MAAVKERALTLAVTGGVLKAVPLKVEARGVRLAPNLPFEQWREMLRMWRGLKDTWQFGVADFMSYGAKAFGEEKVQAAMEQLLFDLKDGLHGEVIGQIPLDLRDQPLSAEHYYVLGRAELTARERGRWAALAVKEEMTPLRLQKSIEAGRVLRKDEIDEMSGKNSGIPTVQGVRFLWDRWARKVGDKAFKWTTDLKRQCLDEIKPIVEFARKLEASL